MIKLKNILKIILIGFISFGSTKAMDSTEELMLKNGKIVCSFKCPIISGFRPVTDIRLDNSLPEDFRYKYTIDGRYFYIDSSEQLRGRDDVITPSKFSHVECDLRREKYGAVVVDAITWCHEIYSDSGHGMKWCNLVLDTKKTLASNQKITISQTDLHSGQSINLRNGLFTNLNSHDWRANDFNIYNEPYKSQSKESWPLTLHWDKSIIFTILEAS